MDVEWIKARKRKLGITDAAIAHALGVERSVANKVVNGGVDLNVRKIDAIADLFEVSRDEMLYRAGITKDAPVEPDLPPTETLASRDGPVTIRSINMGFSMGDGTNFEDFPEETPVVFDPNWLRTVSLASPERLFVARGDGDSMSPTLMNEDQVLIDTTQRTINLQDRVWALSVHGASMIKRLRIVGKETIRILSDNSLVPPQDVSAEDIHIVGRVVWIGRRM